MKISELLTHVQFFYIQNNLWFNTDKTNKMYCLQSLPADPCGPKGTLGSLKGHDETGFYCVQLFKESNTSLKFLTAVASCITRRCKVLDLARLKFLSSLILDLLCTLCLC